MIIMAQLPQQQQQNQDSQQRQPQRQQLAHSATAAPTQVNQQQHIKTNGLLQQQDQADGKRTLIKNQLYLIEQLQLENANLRNERDQLQLENEELKFQLQMISSSNILSQPSATFNDQQQLEPLIETAGCCSSSVTANVKINDNKNLTATSLKISSPAGLKCQQGSTTTTTAISNQVKLLATPIRQPIKLNDDYVGHQWRQQQVTLASSCIPLSDNEQPQLAVQSCTAAAITPLVVDAKRPTMGAAGIIVGRVESAILSDSSINERVTLAEENTSSVAFNPVKTIQITPQSRNLPHDDEEQRVKLVEQLYGDSEKVRAAAIIIQRAFRKYQICKRFRTITEQLRHTYQSVNQLTDRRAREIQTSSRILPTTSTTGSKTSLASEKSPHHPSGPTRAAAWESLSYAASRLVANVASNATTMAIPSAPFTTTPDLGSAGGVINQLETTSATKQMPSTVNHQQQVALTDSLNAARQQQRSTKTQQDPVVAAAINFQQLESIRKRQYRVGLNIFNKNPEKGVSFLVAHAFIDSSSPYIKSSLSYYQSNQLHLIDKQQQLLPQPQHQSQQRYQTDNQSQTNQSCPMCYEEDNLKRNVAHFLLHRKGLAKEKIGQYLGNLQVQFNQDVLKYYLQELDFHGLQIDLALRKFLSTFRLPGEAQKIERIVDCFAQRYVQCQQQQQNNMIVSTTGNPSNVSIQIANSNQISQVRQQQQNFASSRQNQQQQQQQQPSLKNNLILLSKDEIFILTFAIIMLNTDLHSPSLKPTSRMSASQFVNNLRGVFKSQSINEADLIEIYERVKSNQITTTPDHVNHVMKVQQGLTVTNFQRKELPNLCVPHRRLVCFCRLFEVYDVNKKERVGQHQREIFLFNDLLLVTKLARRVRANSAQLYTYRQSISLQGLYVQLFQSAHYNYGIRLCQRSNDEVLIMFNARNELDQSRFVDDLGESIAEMDEMEMIKAHNIIETMHLKHLERLKRHAMSHSNNIALLPATGSNTNHVEVTSAMIMKNDDTDLANEEGQANKLANYRDIKSTNIGGKQMDKPRQQPNSSSSSLASRGGQSKFNSMLNLSSVSDGKMKDGCKNETHAPQFDGLRQNRSFVQHSDQMFVEQPPAGSSLQRHEQATSRSNTSDQRRCSASSVHSLDSGLFLSRDVSPNQSS